MKHRVYMFQYGHIFSRESSYCFQRVLAIAILSVRPSVRHTGRFGQKRCKARITKSSPSAAWKTLGSRKPAHGGIKERYHRKSKKNKTTTDMPDYRRTATTAVLSR